jgi:Cd2+/Zn2+-exporting ATPase/Cu+-exporting ATPase
MVPLLLTLVHFLEEKSIVGGQDAIDGLRKMQSNVALRIVDGVETQVHARDLKTGDVILVKPGMGFPIDGKVLTGVSSVNAQSLTGEMLPVDVGPSDAVYAGTLNIHGALTVSVEKAWKDTSFQKIIRMLEETGKSVTPESRIMDRFMAYYIPLILVIAALVWFFTGQIERAAAILVVSCPCGHMLISSAPLIASIASASKRGILIRSASFVEKLARADAVFFDKTGTITSGDITIQTAEAAEGVSDQELYTTAFSLSQYSAHPLSKAIASQIAGYPAEEGYSIEERGGMGVIGTRGEDVLLLGSDALLSDYGITVPHSFRSGGMFTHAARNGRYLGRIGFSDTIREGAKEMIDELKKMGINDTCLLTGDKLDVALRLQRECGIGDVKAQVLPEQKQRIINEARESRNVVFVGDGVNDALALSEADIGIAMAAMGNDTAIQSADISLMNNHMSGIPFIINLARRAQRIIRQNMLIAFLSSILMILLSGIGVITVLPGALLHNVGAFAVLLNSGRILQKQTSDSPEGGDA